MTRDDFIMRFTAKVKEIAGFDTFDDGTTVDSYCEIVAARYYAEPLYRDDGPEFCAEQEVSDWGEE